MSSSKRRPCPALNKTITSADCGAQRHSRIPCPAECPFNPFAPERAGEALGLDAQAVVKWLERLRRDPAGLPAGFSPRLTEDVTHLQDCLRLLRHTRALRDERGLTFWQRWEKARWEGLKNDEQVFLGRLMNARFRLLEVRSLRPGGLFFEAVDLWDPAAGRLLVAEGNLWAEANRFDGILALLPELPHFHWANFGAIRVLAPDQQSVGARFEVILRHLGCPGGEAERQAWLEENLVRVDEALTAVGKVEAAAYDQRTEPSRLATARYSCDPPSRCETVTGLLRARPDCHTAPSPFGGPDSGEVAFSVEDANPVVQVPAGLRPLLGRVRVENGSVTLSANGIQRLTRLRDWLLEAAGHADWLRPAHFPSPLPVEPRLSERQKSLIPPGLVVDALPDPLLAVEYLVSNSGPATGDRVRELRDARWNWTLEQPQDRLGGRSVAQALTDPEARAEILAWGKNQVNRADAMEDGHAADLEPRLRELGLVELLEPLPPPRPSRLPEPPGLEWENSVREAFGEDEEEEDLDDDLSWEDEDEDEGEWEDDGAGDAERPRQTTESEIVEVQARLQARDPDALKRKKELARGRVSEVLVYFHPFGLDDECDDQVDNAVESLLLVAFPGGKQPEEIQRGRLFRYAEEEFERIMDLVESLPPGGDMPQDTREALRASALDKELGKYAFDLLKHPDGLGAEHRADPGPQIYALAFAFGLIREIAHHRPVG